jgi:hypothetical protein
MSAHAHRAPSLDRASCRTCRHPRATAAGSARRWGRRGVTSPAAAVATACCPMPRRLDPENPGPGAGRVNPRAPQPPLPPRQLMLKDLRLVLQLASATKTPAPMAQNVSQLYRTVGAGSGGGGGAATGAWRAVERPRAARVGPRAAGLAGGEQRPARWWRRPTLSKPAPPRRAAPRRRSSTRRRRARRSTFLRSSSMCTKACPTTDGRAPIQLPLPAPPGACTLSLTWGGYRPCPSRPAHQLPRPLCTAPRPGSAFGLVPARFWGFARPPHAPVRAAAPPLPLLSSRPPALTPPRLVCTPLTRARIPTPPPPRTALIDKTVATFTTHRVAAPVAAALQVAWGSKGRIDRASRAGTRGAEDRDWGGGQRAGAGPPPSAGSFLGGEGSAVQAGQRRGSGVLAAWGPGRGRCRAPLQRGAAAAAAAPPQRASNCTTRFVRFLYRILSGSRRAAGVASVSAALGRRGQHAAAAAAAAAAGARSGAAPAAAAPAAAAARTRCGRAPARRARCGLRPLPVRPGPGAHR